MQTRNLQRMIKEHTVYGIPTGLFLLTSKVEEEMGEVLSIETQETEMDFYQSVNVMPETIYCFTLGIRGQGAGYDQRARPRNCLP